MKIFLDMDEVLVDFVGTVCEEWGVTLAEVQAHWVPGRWDVIPPLSAALGRTATPISTGEFWRRLDGRPEFWADMKALPWLNDLLDLLTDYEWYVVSSPSWCESSYLGKVRWLKKRFGRTFDRFFITPHKELLAGPGRMLIDDRDTNVEKFVMAGGGAIVFPRYHNSRWAHRSDPLMYVESILRRLKGNITKEQSCT